MDPFVVVSFSKKVFRTRVIRHSLNPQWDEKLLFHVRKHEETYEVKFAVLDWDKLTGNDQIGEVSLPLNELMVNAPQADPVTGLYAEGVETPDDMKEFVLNLSMSKESTWEAKHSPKLILRWVSTPHLVVLLLIVQPPERSISRTMHSASVSGGRISNHTTSTKQARSLASSCNLCSTP